MIRAYTYKLLRSPLLYISILGIAALCFSNFVDDRFGYATVSYHVQRFFDLAQYRNCLILLGALPFAANFADEWNSGIAKECIVRIGVKKYAVQNAAFCWFSSFIAVFLGIWLFSCIDSLFVPWSDIDPNPSYTIFGEYLRKGQGEIWLFFASVIYASSCAAWSVMGMLVSAFFTNKFVAICMPLITCYFFLRITRMAPNWVNLHNISVSNFPYEYFNSHFWGFLYCVGIYAAIAAVCGMIFCSVLKRKVQNGVT